MAHENENLEKRDIVGAGDSAGDAPELIDASLSAWYVC